MGFQSLTIKFLRELRDRHPAEHLGGKMVAELELFLSRTEQTEAMILLAYGGNLKRLEFRERIPILTPSSRESSFLLHRSLPWRDLPR